MESATSILKKHLDIDYTTSFNDFLGDQLELLEISKAELGRRVGVSPTAISKIFNNKRPITIEMAIRIAESLRDPISVYISKAQKQQLAMALTKLGKANLIDEMFNVKYA